jgi:hypothetical protein
VTSLLIVRAEVGATDRGAFDHWYETEHLRDAHKAFGSQKSWRGWCEDNPGLHFALYEFPTDTAVRAVLASDELQTLVAEFDRVWGGRVKRTREVVNIQQVFPH